MTESAIQGFYEELFASLEAAGVPVVILGGQALLRHHLAEATKDADLFLRPGDFAPFLAVLARSRYRETAPVYRAVVSAPLANPWAGSGWGSHFEFPVASGPRPRIDVLARPPRIDPDLLPRGGVAPLFLLAETKKTRREAKDWGQVATLGHFLLDSGDSRGLLLLQDEEELKERIGTVPVTGDLISLRPNLRLALENSIRLGPALETERRFWRWFDAERWAVFEAAARPYSQAVRACEPGFPSALPAQHTVLCEIAERFLPKDPIGQQGIESLIKAARNRALLGYPPDFEEFLPPESVVAQPWKRKSSGP